MLPIEVWVLILWEKKHHKKYRKPITKSSKLPIRGRFADLFCSQSRSGLTEARAFSRETPLVIQEVEIAFGLLDNCDRTKFLHCFCCCCYCWCSITVLLMMHKLGGCLSNGFILSAWRRCALDIICSANTIRSYINRFGKVRWETIQIKIQIKMQIQIKCKHDLKDHCCYC